MPDFLQIPKMLNKKVVFHVKLFCPVFNLYIKWTQFAYSIYLHFLLHMGGKNECTKPRKLKFTCTFTTTDNIFWFILSTVCFNCQPFFSVKLVDCQFGCVTLYDFIFT